MLSSSLPKDLLSLSGERVCCTRSSSSTQSQPSLDGAFHQSKRARRFSHGALSLTCSLDYHVTRPSPFTSTLHQAVKVQDRSCKVLEELRLRQPLLRIFR